MTLGADPVAAVLAVLRGAGSPCTAAEIKKTLEHAGAELAQIDTVWPRVQKRLRQHRCVAVEGGRGQLTYRYVEPAPPSPEQALDRLLAGGLAPAERERCVEVVREALRRSAADPAEAARRRQARIDDLRALAELASEVEELVANQASAGTLVQRVRGRVGRSGLEPVDRAGEETRYDRTRHRPIGASIADGAPVIVVRPGYVWKSSDGDVPISRPVVEE